MNELLNNQMIQGAVALVVLVFLIRLLVKVFSKPKVDTMHVKVKCKSCGWVGQVGKYNRVCYQCNGKELISMRKR